VADLKECSLSQVSARGTGANLGHPATRPSSALGSVGGEGKWASLQPSSGLEVRQWSVITVTPHPTDLFGMHASVDGLAVYLDLFAVKELAKGDPARRKRFISLLDRGVEILFSVANAAELSGPQGASFDKMRAFLDDIGPRWFPVEFDPYVCIQRERELKDPLTCCFSERLLKAFTATEIRQSTSIKIDELPTSLPPDFFRLGLFMEWLAPQRQDIRARKRELGRRLKDEIMEHRAKHEKDQSWLDAHFPVLPFRGASPATFVHVNVVRQLILESKSHVIVPNDGIDFAQAVIGSAYASVATLDKHWKRRIEMLPKPNRVARIYYQQELDRMVRDIERQLDRVALERGRAVSTAS
jgi:hypothetical protein